MRLDLLIPLVTFGIIVALGASTAYYKRQCDTLEVALQGTNKQLIACQTRLRVLTETTGLAADLNREQCERLMKYYETLPIPPANGDAGDPGIRVLPEEN
jgi:hypothetical protein